MPTKKRKPRGHRRTGDKPRKATSLGNPPGADTKAYQNWRLKMRRRHDIY